jgi:hypothetical protein
VPAVLGLCEKNKMKKTYIIEKTGTHEKICANCGKGVDSCDRCNSNIDAYSTIYCDLKKQKHYCIKANCGNGKPLVLSPYQKQFLNKCPLDKWFTPDQVSPFFDNRNSTCHKLEEKGYLKSKIDGDFVKRFRKVIRKDV